MQQLIVCFWTILLFWISFAASQDDNGTEVIPPDEPQIIAAIESLFYNSMNEQYQQGQYPWLRQAHAKQHGCVRANVTVYPDLPYDIAQGVFANEITYPAFIRFSNGVGHGFSTLANNDEPDSFPDTRGFAMKLFQVPGVKFIDPSAETQDFLTTTSEQGSLPDDPTALGFFTAVQNGTLALAAFLAENPSVAVLLAKFGANGAISDVLTANWYSQVPIRLKYKAAKFSFSPVQCNDFKLPMEKRQALDPNFLQTQLQTDLSGSQSWCFNMSAQLFTDDESTPVENATVVWDSPWYPIALVEIPPQYVWSDGQEQFCRQLAFNPWNAIKEHQPLGFIQRIKHVIYTQGAAQRHQLDGEDNSEPTYQDWLNYPSM